ncbi:MAG TPA: DUF4349 domain-containing protein [Polyangiaceae bacterium]
MTRFGIALEAFFALGSLLAGCGQVAPGPRAPLATHASANNAQAAFADDAALTRYTQPGTKASAPAAGSTGAPPAVAAAAPADAGARTPEAEAREMYDIEAHLALLVASVSDARTQLRKLAAARGATVTSDISSDSDGQREANLVLRVPTGSNDAFMVDVERLGEITSRQIIAKDVGKEYRDSEILRCLNRPTR